MSANNQLIIQRSGDKFTVSDVDVDGCGGHFIAEKALYDTLEDAIKAANKYQEENEVEYGLNISI